MDEMTHSEMKGIYFAWINDPCSLVSLLVTLYWIGLHYIFYIPYMRWYEEQHVFSVFPPAVAVAVVKRAARNIFMGNLGGRRSCHGHMYSPAGWLLPFTHNLSLAHNNSFPCNPNKGRVWVWMPHTNTCCVYRWLRVTIIYLNVFLLLQPMTACSGRAVFLVPKGTCVKFAWVAQGRLPPSAALTTTMSVTMATWEHYGECNDLPVCVLL